MCRSLDDLDQKTMFYYNGLRMKRAKSMVIPHWKNLIWVL